MSVNIIVAVGKKVEGKGYPIGVKGALPWRNKADMRWFKSMTDSHPVIMGRKTYESIGHPLPNRMNIVVSSRTDLWNEEMGIRVSDSLESAVAFAKTFDKEIFIIGGGTVYQEALEKHLVETIYIDFLSEEAKGADTFFPVLNHEWVEDKSFVAEGPERGMNIRAFKKIRGWENKVDEAYFNIVKDILANGVEKDTRAGKTLSVFGRMARFDLKKGLPVLTTKKVYLKGVIHELLWFLKGDTNIKYLVENNVHIWDDDAYRYYKEIAGSEGLDKETFLSRVKNEVYEDKITNKDKSVYRYGDLGPIYGHQWRNWNNNGVDQIKNVIETLKTNPDDRRMIVSAWNPTDIPDMALPPCHYCCQFYTRELSIEERKDLFSKENGVWTDVSEELLDEKSIPKRELSCLFSIRSNDFGLGASFNWASYGLLTYIIAHCVGMTVGDLVYSVGDCHIYKNHIEPLKEQLKHNPYLYALPSVEVNPEVKDIDDIKYEDIKVVGYESYPSIKMELSVG